MKPLIVFFIIFCAAGCSTSKPNSDLVLPELLTQYPLPPFPKPVSTSNLRIELRIFIYEDGSVRQAEIISPNGDSNWDSAAIESICKWKYSPAIYQGKPIRLWLKQNVVLRFSNPQIFFLAEIVCNSKQSADSAFLLLEQGEDFKTVVEKFSSGQSREKKGIIGEINIQMYPETVQSNLRKLEVNEHSAPIKYGNNFVIFKRLQNLNL